MKKLIMLLVLLLTTFASQAYHRVCFPTNEALSTDYEAKNGLLYLVKTPDVSSGKLNIQMPVVDQGTYEGGVNLVCPLRTNASASGELGFIDAPEIYIGAAWTSTTTSISSMVSCDLVVKSKGADVYRRNMTLVPLTSDFSKIDSTNHNIEKRNTWTPEGFTQKAYLQSYGARVADVNYILAVQNNLPSNTYFECDVNPNFDILTSITINVNNPNYTVQ